MNFFSIMKALESGWNLSNEVLIIKLDKGNFDFSFDCMLQTELGAIMAVKMYLHLDTMNITLEPGMTVNITKLHLLLGHACEQTFCKTVNKYGINLKDNFLVCLDCAMSKA
jgi:hypothetical protein